MAQGCRLAVLPGPDQPLRRGTGLDSPAMTPPTEDRMRFAQDPLAYLVPGPDEERIDDERFVLTFSPGRHVWSTSVGRPRLAEDSIGTALEEVRTRMRERGRSSSVWVVGDKATPPGLVAQLQGLGLEDTGTSDALLLEEPPRRGSATGLEVRPVATLEELRASIEITVAAFDWPVEDAEDERARAEETFRAERTGGGSTRLLAFDAGGPVATGRAWFSSLGLYLGGGATLPTERGRGAMTSLLGAAWDAAVTRGTPALVTHGGEMSSPILLKLGFRRVGRVTHLVDRIA